MYNQGRPSYSNAALSKISELILKIPLYDEKLQLVELGAGTGKFTNSFSEFAVQTKLQRKIGSYTAIEPSDGFRTSLIASVSPSITVANGTGSKMPSETNSIDAVFIAQAFHWMANTETLTEIHRVLKSKSPLILIWNSYDYSSSNWLKVIDEEILTPNYGDVPRQQSGQWRDCFYTEEGSEIVQFIPYV
jgi:ubiquinone/menaquinone biosynthesis C-methylase UbiE